MFALDEILAEITPPRLEQLILEVAYSRDPGERAGVDVGDVVGHIVAGRDLGVGAERSQAYRILRDAIRENVGLVAGIEYVKSSD